MRLDCQHTSHHRAGAVHPCVRLRPLLPSEPKGRMPDDAVRARGCLLTARNGSPKLGSYADASPTIGWTMIRRLLRSARTIGLALACLTSSAAAEDLTRDAALAAARAAAHYMVSVETADGRFLYQFDFLVGRFVHDDNIVRQAGAAYGLNEYVFATRDAAIVEPARRAIAYAQSHSVAYGPGQLVSADGTAAKDDVGATALAALGAIYSLRIHDDDGLRAAVKAWISGIEAVQLPDGAFPAAADANEQDSYGSGEAWLALAHWAEIEPDDAAAAAALQRADAYLMGYYQDHPDLQFFHWGLQ